MGGSTVTVGVFCALTSPGHGDLLSYVLVHQTALSGELGGKKSIGVFTGVRESSWMKLEVIYKTVDKHQYIYQWLVITPLRGRWLAASCLAQLTNSSSDDENDTS